MNKIGRLFLALPVSILLNQSNALGAGSLDIEFSGELVSTACKVATESLNKKITLYNLRWQQINENETSAVTPFVIAIDNCSATDLQKSIKLTWQSNQLVTIDGNSFLTTQGVSGVVLGILDKDDNPIVWNKPMTLGDVSVVDNTQQFDFGVVVRKPATGEAKIGDFSGTVTFNVEYE